MSVINSFANAGIIIGGTRVIYEGNKKEASLSIKNPDTVPYLIQSWIETINGVNDKSPFLITPPLYRLEQGQQNIERILLLSELSQDTEHLFWVNIKAIPASDTTQRTNTLQIAVKTKLKLIYRPAKLYNSSPEEQADKLIWQKSGNQISVNNPTKYVINFNDIQVAGKNVDAVTYILPGKTVLYNLPHGVSNGIVVFRIISDYGTPGKPHKNYIQG